METIQALVHYLSTRPDSVSLYEQPWLTGLPTVPSSVRTLAVRSCRNLVDVGDDLPDSIQILNLYGANILPQLPARLPAGLKRLMLNHCDRLTGLPALPAGLEHLDLDDAKGIVAVDDLPDGLLELSLNRCSSLKRIGELPQSLQALCIRDCKSLDELPALPPQLKTLFITNCGLKKLPELPDSVKILDVNGVEHLIAGRKMPAAMKSMIAFGGWLHRG